MGLEIDAIMSQVQHSLDGQNNAEITRRLLTILQVYTRFLRVTMPISYSNALQLQDYSLIFEMLNTTLVMVGYMMHHRTIRRDEVSSKIYYIRIVGDTNHISPFHPLSLMSSMADGDSPRSFKLLLTDVNYLPNIINIFDYGHPDMVMELTIQSVRVL
jgi:hypothetical protein